MTRIHLIGRDNGAGLSRDLRLVADTLDAAGFDVTVSAIGQEGTRKLAHYLGLRAHLAWRGWREGESSGRFALNLFAERIWRPYLALARCNALLPNPEWFKPAYAALLPAIDCVFAKTHHAEALFARQGCRTRHVGFTSEDRLRTEVPREPTFLHVAGRSRNKGTQALIDAWHRRPDWPMLTVVQRADPRARAVGAPNLRVLTHYLGDEELRILQNQNLFHLCPSETEGFGHHLVEAMSVGAIVLTTDAAPMNELVGHDRGVLIPYARSGAQQLATTYFVSAESVAGGVERMLAFDANERRLFRERARSWYEDNDRSFRQRLPAAVGELAG